MTQDPVPAGERAPTLRATLLLLGGLALLKILIHVVAIQEYGYFRDELYYLASTRHLDFGYVDHPPFSIYLLAAHTAVFGNSLIALRALPILAGAAMVLLSGLICRELGGGLFAQGLAALAIVVAPVVLGTQHFYSMNAFDQLFWALSVYLLCISLKSGKTHFWLLLGVALGLGLFNKISVLWLGLGLSAGLLFSAHRSWLRTRWPWIAAGIAFVVFLPYVGWQLVHGFPTLDFMSNAAQYKMMRISVVEFFSNQMLAVNPVASPLYLAGIVGLLVVRDMRKWRILGTVFAVVVVVLLASGTSKTYYLAAAYPLLAAPGAYAIEKLLSRKLWRALGLAYGLVMLASGILFAPLAIPLLPPDRYSDYVASLGIAPPQEERSRLGALPQHFADMFGWKDLAEKVARAYHNLSPEDQEKCIVFGQNYGEAGAIDLFGRRLGVPGAISGHNSYWMWGPRDYTGEVMIIIGGDPEGNAELFETIEQVDVTECVYCMPYERGVPIFVARKMKQPMREVWPKIRNFN